MEFYEYASVVVWGLASIISLFIIEKEFKEDCKKKIDEIKKEDK